MPILLSDSILPLLESRYRRHHVPEHRIRGFKLLAAVHDRIFQHHARMSDSEIFGNPEKGETILKRYRF